MVMHGCSCGRMEGAVVVRELGVGLGGGSSGWRSGIVARGAGRPERKKMKNSSDEPLNHSGLEPLPQFDHLLFPLDAALVAAF